MSKEEGRKTRPDGFSEEAWQGYQELLKRAPPPSVKPETFGAHPKPDHRPHYWGHRERLRQRFLKGGAEALPDYELLELVLFNAIPRIDVKPLAKELLATFGDFNRVISAPAPRLMKFPAVTEKVIVQFRLAEAIAARMAKAKVINRCVLSSWTQLMQYCKTVMAHREIEQFRVLFLDRKNVLLADEEQAKGTVDHVPVYPREVAKRALELNASAVILVHNHPSGDPTPSTADIEMTDHIITACDAIGVAVHDHVIIGKEKDTSFRTTGLI